MKTKKHQGDGKSEISSLNTILIVEDDKGLNRLIQKTLEKAGFRTAQAYNGAGAIAKILEDTEVLILLDYKLPDMNGKQFIENLTLKHLEVPFIVITGQGDERIALEMMKLGAKDYIIKTVDWKNLLLSTVEKVVEKINIEKKLVMTQEILRESEERYRFLYQESPSINLVINSTSRIENVNRTALEVMGYSEKEVVGKDPLDFIVPEHKEIVAIEIGKAFKGEHTPELEVDINAKDGSIHTILFSAGEALLYERDKTVGVLFTGTDITERKKAEEKLREERNKVQSILDGLSRTEIGIDIIGIDYRILFQNEVLKERFEDAIGELCYEKYMGLKEPCNFCPMIKAIKNKTVESVELTAADGRCYELFSAPLPNPDGTVDKVIEVVKDITVRKRTEEALRESEERYRLLFDSAPDSVIVADTEGVIIDCSRSATILHRRSRDELIGMNVSEFVSPSLIPSSSKELPQMMQQKPIAGEIKIVRSDGTTVDVWHKGVPLTDSHGNFSGMLVYSRDVTERKDMEGTLRESKAQLRQVIDLVPHMIYAKDRDGRFLLANKVTADGCETSTEDMINKTHQELHSPVVEEYEMYLKDDREVIDGGKIKFIPEENFTYPDGHTVVLETTKIPFTTTGIPAVLGVSVDITERKRAIETQLVLQNIANAVNTSKDISELCVSIQKHLSKIIDTTNFLLGLYNEENDTLSFTFKVDEKDKYTSFPLGKTPTAYVIRTGKPLLATKKVIDELTKAGKVKMIGTPSEIWLGVPLKFDNEVVGIITVQSYDNASAYTPKDVKLLEFVSNQIAIGLQRKRAEEALKESKAKLQAVFDGVNDPMYVIDKNYRVVMTNKSLLELKNISQGEAIGNYCYEVYHDRKERCKACAVQKVFETRDIAKVETSFSVPDGSFRFFEVYGYPLFDENGDVYQVLETTRDITDRKLLEEELLQSQKMEAIGTLAGGIAHDFNNLLTGILVNCDLLLDKVSEKATYKENIEEIYRIASSATSLTRQLLAFGRRQVIQPELIDLNVLVANMGKMLNRVIGEDIEFETTFSTYSEYIKADPGQIEQVLMNLVVNSRDAMPEGGKLAIKIESVVISEGTVSKAFQVKPGKYVLTSITDTGKGIDKDKLDHIFEPFYTTKDEGTGLGLSVVYGIVKQHNGFLNVYSEPGKGSTFKVYLPVYTTEQEVKLEKEVRSNELKGSGERILFVEDQNKIRTIICKVLREKGYVVFEAANANEAVNIYNVEHGEFDIVVSDVVLPGKSGVELIEELQAQNPKLSVLLTSGYADEKSRWISIKEKGYHFLKKPYTTRELLKVIKEVIKE